MDSAARTRVFQAGAARFAVDCPSEEVKGQIETMFVDLHSADDVDPTIFAVLDAIEPARYIFHTPENQMPPATLATVATFLVTAVTRLSLDSDPSRLHLHCAALSREDSGVVVAAGSGIGKTTLAAGLLARDWDYLSDESAAIAEAGDALFGFAKPLSFKPGAAMILSDIPASGSLPHDEPDGSWNFVPASAFGVNIVEEVRPHVLVVLERDGRDLTRPATYVRVHPADALVKLMGQTMDAGRFGADAVLVLARLVARCQCVVLTVGAVETEVEIIESLVRAEHPGGLDAAALDMAAVEIDGWRPEEVDVRAVQLGDRIAVHQLETGAIVALDLPGTALWLALHGEPPDWWAPELARSPEAKDFLHRLASIGFVRPSPSKAAPLP